jgi:iron complex outermembrane receptor protein
MSFPGQTSSWAGPLDDLEPLTDIVDTLDVISDRPELAEKLSTFVTVHEVGDRASRVSTLSDVIEEGAGVHVRRYGGLGAYSTASIRASSPGQVEIYLDGVPLKSAQWGAVNLSDLPLVSLSRIEVYRGGAPAEFGTAGIGGVVNLVTRPVGDAYSMASVSAGSHGTRKLDIIHSGGLRTLDYLVSYHHLQSEGDFAYLDRHGTPENPDDDEIVTRENNDFRQSDILIRVGLPLWGGWRLEAAEEVFWKQSGVPGIENVHIKSVHYEIFRNIARVSVASPRLLGDAVGLKASGFGVYRRDLFFNPDDEVGFSLTDTDNRSRSHGANLLTTLTWHRFGQELRLFGEVRRERFTPEDENPAIGVGFTRERTARTFSVEDGAFLFRDRLELVAGYRYQEAADNYAGPIVFGGPPEPLDDPHWSTFHGPSLGARWRPHPRIAVKANRTRYGRFPSMIELFGASGSVEGNPELSTEEGTTTDVGVEFRTESPRKGFFEAALFWCDREDLIVFLQNSQRTVKALNLESAHVEGVELTARRAFGTALRASASYTLQAATNTGPSPTYHGKRLPYEPKHELFVRTTWDGGRVAVWHEYHFEGEAYRDRANLPENLSPATHVHGAGIRVEVVPGALSVTLEVNNLMDERIVDVEGYPLPGRTFFATLEAGAATTGRE